MSEIICRQALERVLTYLGEDGVELTPEACRRAFRLVESAMDQGCGADLPARCISRIPDYFDRPSEIFPEATPPLERGHIGYD
ncbi:MAG: hypothetical protein ACQEV6_05290 [Pseudomonadota bacterium]